ASAMTAAGANPSLTFVATGTNWPDSVGAGPASAALHAPLLLVDGRGGIGDTASERWLEGNRGRTSSVAVTRGIGAVAAPVAPQIAEASTLVPTSAPTPARFCTDPNRVTTGSTTTTTTPSSTTTTT